MIYRCRLCEQPSLALLTKCPRCRRECTFEVDEAAPETVGARREALATAGRLQRRALAGGDDADARSAIGGSASRSRAREPEPIEATVSADYHDVEDVVVRRRVSGVEALDWVLGDEDGDGFPMAYCVVFGGRRGGGKSTIARQWIVGALMADPAARAAYLVREEGHERVKRGLKRAVDAAGAAIERGRLRIAVPAAPGRGGHLDALIEEISSLAGDGFEHFAVDSMRMFARGDTHCAEVSERLRALAESLGVAILLIAHMNGEGKIAGGEKAQHGGDACLLMETLPGGVRKLWCDGKHRFGPGDREAFLAFEDGAGLARVDRARAMAIVAAAAEEERAEREAEAAMVAAERAKMRKRRGGAGDGPARDEAEERDHDQA